MQITTLFLDIGGVFLSNGWDHSLRKRAAAEFHLNYDEVDQRHQSMFDAYERGKLSLDEYLQFVIFYQTRSFTLEQFKSFIFNSAQALPKMLDLVKELKKQYQLRVVFVSNEGREIAEDRIKRFDLKQIGDFFIVSSFVGVRKPDLDMYRFAIDLSQSAPNEVLYIDDRKLLVEIANSYFGINGIHHQDYETTKTELNKYFTTFLVTQ